ncbi:hypothetical protein [Streptomyces ficellus]|uniref:DUF7847 domain-containing protein n=1 Tax=Streptomyces ficellus TaxID=1977088 RepID=A0A6I6FLW4_9ACTN|nr:hypothetical protein [Streptomyces ficellus]QGV81242.1 hypothetical protein EIZ62_25595 [Streptomyces ficellus]
MSQHTGWGPPTGPPPGPPGGPYGWGGGWAPPPPPKPGVIPLGPLGVAEVLGGAFATLGRHWKQFLGIALAAYAAALVLFGGVLLLAYLATREDIDRLVDGSPRDFSGPDAYLPLLATFVGVYLFGMLVLLLANAVVCASCPAVLQDAVLGRPVTIGTVWRRARSRLGAVLGSLLLVWLIAAVPMLLMLVALVTSMVSLFAVAVGESSGMGWLLVLSALGVLATAPVAVWLWVRFSFAPAVAVFEGRGALDSMARSAQLVRGDWWRVLGISLLGSLIAWMASYAIQMPFSFVQRFAGDGFGEGAPSAEAAVAIVVTSLAFGVIAQIVAQVFTAAFPQLVVALLYVDQRIRRENLAATLAAAANAPRQERPLGT